MRPQREIEYSFFGCIFDDPQPRILQAFQEKAKVEWFTDDQCRLMWAAIESINAERGLTNVEYLQITQEAIRLHNVKNGEYHGIPLNTETFYAEAMKYRNNSADEMRSDIQAYSEILRNGSIERRIKSAMQESESAFMTENNTESVGSDLSNKIASIIESESSSKNVNVSELLENMCHSYDVAYDEFAVKKNYDFVSGIPMPWSRVSKMMNGLQPGVHLIAARPSVGKTSFVLQCIDFWCASGYKVVFNCLDMAVSQIIKRPVANLSRVSIDRAEQGMCSESERKRINAAVKTVDNWYRTGKLNLLSEYDVSAFKTWCKIQHATGKLDIAVIDYAQQLRIRGGGKKTENDRLTQISAILKSIAIELNIPVVVLSQLSRDNVKDQNGPREPTIADLRGSGALEQDAFSVTLLHKDDATIKAFQGDPNGHTVAADLCPDEGDITEKNISAVGAVWWIHAKNQNGRTGRLPFVVYQNHYRWYVGDTKAEPSTIAPKNISKFSQIEADWRFNEEPMISVANRGKVVYPKYWPQKCERICRRLGIEVPLEIQRQLDQYRNEHTVQTRLAEVSPLPAQPVVSNPVSEPQPMPSDEDEESFTNNSQNISSDPLDDDIPF